MGKLTDKAQNLLRRASKAPHGEISVTRDTANGVLAERLWMEHRYLALQGIGETQDRYAITKKGLSALEGEG